MPVNTNIGKGSTNVAREVNIGAGVGDAVGNVLTNLQKEAGQIADTENKRQEAIYNRTQSFYKTTTIPDDGVGYKVAMTNIQKERKARYAKIAGKGSKATEEEQIELQTYLAEIAEIQAGSEALKATITSYGEHIDKDGAINESTDEDVADLLKDLWNQTGNFKPVVGEDGKVRLVGETTNGYPVNYTYAQLANLSYSPVFDIDSQIENSKSLIGKEINEYALSGGGTQTTEQYTQDRINAAVKKDLGTQTKLWEIGGSLGFGAKYRRENPDTYEADIIAAYTEQLANSLGFKSSLDGTLTQQQVLAATTNANANANANNSIDGDYQHYGTQIQQGDTTFLNTSVQTALGDPNAFTEIRSSERGKPNSIVTVKSKVTDVSSAKIALAGGKTLTLLDGTVVTAANINDYDDDEIAGATYVVNEYDTNTDVGNSGLFQLYQEGRGFSSKDYGSRISNISRIQGGLGISGPEIDLNSPKEVNKRVIEVLKEPATLNTEAAQRFRSIAQTSGGTKGKSTAGKYVKAFTDLTGDVPFFLAGSNGKVSDEFSITNQNPESRAKLENAISDKLEEYNALKGTSFTIEDIINTMKGKPLTSKSGYEKYLKK